MSNESAWKPLLKEHEGQVFCMNLSTDDDYTFGRLKIMPHSKIKLHLHEDDCEWYLDEESGDTYFCPKGESHEFVNDTDSIKYLLSIKKVV